MTTTTLAADIELADLRAELDNLPEAIEQATEDGDDTELARLLVRDRVLAKKIGAAEGRRRAELQTVLEADRERLDHEFAIEAAGLDDLELAADVYAAAAEAKRRRLEPIRMRLVNVNSRLWDLREQS